MSEIVSADNFLDVYSYFLVLSAEICSSLDDYKNIEKILGEYLSFLENNWTFLSPSNEVQKKYFLNRGINTLISLLNENIVLDIANDQVATKFDLELIVNITNISANFVSYTSSLGGAADSNLYNGLKNNLELIKNSLQQKQEKAEEENSLQLQQKIISKVQTNAVADSIKWQTLLEKIKILKELTAQDKIFESAIVYDDVQKLLEDFDPKEYFPEVFFALYKAIAPNIKKYI